jgi:quercetin dioxygenase-like cupin family protein
MKIFSWMVRPSRIIFRLTALTTATAGAQQPQGATGAQVEITRAETHAAQDGPASYFTGAVKVTAVWSKNEHHNATGSLVTFEPGARSVWHVHPSGQRLFIISGLGLTQQWGKAVQEIRPGDTVWCPPGVKHWHGAAPNMNMSHLAITGMADGEGVKWMEKVSDAQYNAR